MMILSKLLFRFLSMKGFFMSDNMKFVVSILVVFVGVLFICCLIAEVPVLFIEIAHVGNHALI